jgi:hypothetical protein
MLSKLFIGCVSTTPCGNFELQITVTDIAQHTPYQGFSVTGYIRTGTGVKQTEVDCELTDGALSSAAISPYLINDCLLT